MLAVDRDPEMIVYARQTIAESGLDNVTVRQLPVEELGDDIGPLRMTIFGASFHWTDRQRIAETLFDRTEPGGYLAALSGTETGRGAPEWETVVREVLVRHLGPEQRAGSGMYRPGELHQQVLGRTRFRSIETIDIPVRESRWNRTDRRLFVLDLFRLARGPERSGHRVRAQTYRRRFARVSPSNQFARDNEITVILAQRPTQSNETGTEVDSARLEDQQ